MIRHLFSISLLAFIPKTLCCKSTPDPDNEFILALKFHLKTLHAIVMKVILMPFSLLLLLGMEAVNELVPLAKTEEELKRALIPNHLHSMYMANVYIKSTHDTG